jgi:hypothetical protein
VELALPFHQKNPFIYAVSFKIYHIAGLPTGLTQRRRSEGRGSNFAVQPSPKPRRKKLCTVCGAEGVQNRYCRSCAVEVSRETMVRVALIGHEAEDF